MSDDLEEEYDIFMRESHETAGKRATLAFTRGQVKRAMKNLIAELEEKMGCLDLSGGAYGQLNCEDTEETRTISEKDWIMIKKAGEKS